MGNRSLNEPSDFERKKNIDKLSRLDRNRQGRETQMSRGGGAGKEKNEDVHGRRRERERRKASYTRSMIPGRNKGQRPAKGLEHKKKGT